MCVSAFLASADAPAGTGDLEEAEGGPGGPGGGGAGGPGGDDPGFGGAG